jgi:glycosyltransferase domain-containing protein
MINKVAILIPTINRSEFLIRQLRYYALVKSPHPVYVGDASDEEHKRKVETCIAGLGGAITIHYYHWPQCTDRQAYKRLSGLVEEEFSAFSGDDDFLVPDSLTRCAAFLKQNPEYSTAQGKGVVFELKKAGAFGDFEFANTYWRKTGAEETTGRERLLSFSKNYWVANFSVHRTNELREDSDVIGEMLDTSLAEVLHNFLFHIKGKSKNVDCLYLFRQVHPAQHSSPLFEWNDDPFSNLTSKDWHPTCMIFLKTTIAALAKTDGINESAASEIVRQCLWSYLANAIHSGYEKTYGNATFIDKPPIKFLRGIGVVRSMRYLRSLVTARYGELSLPALLNRSSPYNNDFKIVYEVVTRRAN